MAHRIPCTLYNRSRHCLLTRVILSQQLDDSFNLRSEHLEETYHFGNSEVFTTGFGKCNEFKV